MKNAPQSLYLAYRSRKSDAVFTAVRKVYPAFMPVRNKGGRPINKQQCYYNPTNRLPELRVELGRVEVIETDAALVEAVSATCSNREVSATFFLKKVRGNWRINKIKQG